jgi:hypothetical protein
VILRGGGGIGTVTVTHATVQQMLETYDDDLLCAYVREVTAALDGLAGWCRGSLDPIVDFPLVLIECPVVVALHFEDQRDQRDHCKRPKEGK